MPINALVSISKNSQLTVPVALSGVIVRKESLCSCVFIYKEAYTV